MTISNTVLQNLQKASWIRKMFEIGLKLRQQYGAENVFDFSLGNPDLASPDDFNKHLVEEAAKSGKFLHGYMPNAGYPETRRVLADYLEKETGIPYEPQHLVMTVGAAGAMNVILKSILNPRDEVIVLAPYFAEYNFYITNHNGVKIVAETTDELLPDIHEIRKKISDRTKAIIINSPNNPTGRIYPAGLLEELARLLEEKSRTNDNPIYLISDEPYRKILYDDFPFESPVKFYKNSIMATSFSKDLSLAGERIGYMAIHPEAADLENLVKAANFCNRTLGFVNAPALMQRVIPHVLDTTVDVSIYKRRRDRMLQILKDIGYEVQVPEGAFYLFPKSPIEDDIEFVQRLQEQMVLVTPGTGFHRPGHFRISYSVEEKTIENSAEGFRKAFELAKQRI